MSVDTAATSLSPRRRELLDAAVHVVADDGLRGLTHRAVDRRAGLPEGSCSAYFRTRRALQTSLAEYVAAALAADVADLAEQLRGLSGADDRAAGLTAQLFLRWLDERELLLAKLELSLEASRDAELATVLTTSRSQLVGVVAGIMVAQGRDHATERAEALVASFDGILVAALPKPDPERRDFLSGSLRLLMAALGAPAGPPA
ncbi:ABC-F family ATP-binding cassette domain-containing protein [Nocardioides koreensis]|uniref:ABC-F family ATP-binding cassette domain-containing protein n=1 Tax=Nocardioides koreensis TaxID=433651 RepID=A0ABN3A1W0_9ACTN